MGAPQDDLLARIDAATDRLLHTVRRFTDGDVRQPSLLPGWTRAHVLAHAVGGAGALRNLLDGAHSGEVIPATALPEAGWERSVQVLTGAPVPATELLDRRLVELELHHADLDARYGVGDWPQSFVELDVREPMRSQRADRLAWSR